MSTTSGALRTGWILALLVLAVAVGPIGAQETAGALQGTVVSTDGGPEPEVRVIVSGSYLQGTRETTTDRTGFFQFLALPPGRYALRLNRLGLQPLDVREAVVELGRTTAVGPLAMTPQPIEMAPVVVAKAPLKLDPVSTTAGGNLSAKDYDQLPVDRDYKSLISVLPQVNQSYRGDPLNVGGSTGLENQYYIDGINVTDAKYAIRATSLPYEFVRAVEVKSGGYEAQYGRALGAVVNAVTYSGGNEVEGSVFGFVQPGAWAMTPATSSADRAPVSYDFGARVSGPVVRDRLWYSAAVNPQVDQVEKEIPGQGYFLDRTIAVRLASKLTWRASPATNLELSAFGDPAVQDAVGGVTGPLAPGTTVLNSDAMLWRWETGGTSASLRGTWAPRPSLLLRGSVARQWARWVIRPEAQGTNYRDFVEGTMSGGGGLDMDDRQVRTSVSACGTLVLLRHTVVAGAEYEDIRLKTALQQDVILRLGDAFWQEDHGAYKGTVYNRSPAVYVQDTWRITDRLALNAGLRWSAQDLVGGNGQTAQEIADEWQPRAGFSWQLGRAGAQRLFGSYGRFYQTLPLNVVTNYLDWTELISHYSTDPRQPGAVPDTVIDASTMGTDFAMRIPGLQAESFDEFTLGCERMLGAESKLTIRGMRRNLRSSLLIGLDYSHDPIWVLGTPGKGELSFLPPAKREYTALEVAAEGTWKRVRYRTSYVLSRSWGNYPGLYGSDFGNLQPGISFTLMTPDQAVNSTGYLPNDRRHVAKLSTAYDTGFGLGTGALFTFESGAPINDWGAGLPPYTAGVVFLVPRGTAGRTPALWNLDLRLTYELPLARGPKARLQADLLHVGNPRRATWVDEQHYYATDADGNQDLPNPNYKLPRAYQPPMAARVGLQVSF